MKPPDLLPPDDPRRFERYGRILPYSKVDADGRKVCMWCGDPRVGRALYYCSPECRAEANFRNSPAEIRHFVFARDRGICALCGRDAEAALRAVRRLQASTKRKVAHPLAWRLLRAYRHCLPSWVAVGRSPWTADHIIPVYLGGGCCGPSNIRTLCWICDAEVTAQQAAHRAGLRREAKLEGKRRAVAAEFGAPQLELWP